MCAVRYRIALGMGTAATCDQSRAPASDDFATIRAVGPCQKGAHVSEKNPIRVFVTHTFEEGDDYLRVFEFLESVDRFFYLNTSKPEDMPTQGGLEAIKEQLILQIKAAEVVIVIPAVYEQQTDLVTYMMDVAKANKTGMIAIRPYGGLTETPPEVVARTAEHVEWNAREIVDAIRRVARGEDTARWEVIDFPGFEPD